MRFERFSPRSVSFEALLVWPMLNVAFIFILIFGFRSYLLTGEAGLDLRLPRSVARTPASGASCVIIIDAQGRLYWQGQPVAIEGFEKQLSRSADSSTQVLIKADRRASLNILSSVWDACRRAGVGRVTIATNG